jgi:hypothetical protein
MSNEARFQVKQPDSFRAIVQHRPDAQTVRSLCDDLRYRSNEVGDRHDAAGAPTILDAFLA